MNRQLALKLILYTLVVFSFFRLILCFLSIGDFFEQLNGVFLSFLVGLRFDLSTLGYLSIPIWLVFFLKIFCKSNKVIIKFFNRVIQLYVSVSFFFIILISFIDIGFHFEFHRRVNYLVMDYLAYPKDIVYILISTYPYNILFIIFLGLISFFLIKFWKQNFYLLKPVFNYSIVKHLSKSFITLCLIVFFVRGGIQPIPLNYGNSNFSEHRILNQLSLNPIWNLGKTILTARKEKSGVMIKNIQISLEESVINTRSVYKQPMEEYINDDYPLLRKSISSNPRRDYNVIIILMESFSGQLIGSLGNDFGVSPELDSLAKKGVLFTRMFSTGTRTNRGLAGSLLSFPPIPRYQTILKDAAVDQPFSSLATILKKRDYDTSFIYGGNLHFDNMIGFFRQQGYDNFLGIEDYPDSVFRTMYGVADQYIFGQAFHYLHKLNRPFFSTILTSSNHPPYLFPDYPGQGLRLTTNKSFPKKRLDAFKYSDWALGRFIEKCFNAPFSKNTIFIIVGDHGFLLDGDPNASIDIEMYHVPCLMLVPGMTSKTISYTASHTDIIPTILYLLGGEYVHHSWGKNLLNITQNHSFALVVPAGINHIAGIIYENLFYIHDVMGTDQMFEIQSNGNEIIVGQSNKLTDLGQKAKTTLFSILKSSSHSLFHYKAGLKPN